MKSSNSEYLDPWPAIQGTWNSRHLGHALLIEGDINETDRVANAILRTVLCEREGLVDCGCRACRLKTGEHPDMLLIEDERNISREIIAQSLGQALFRPLWASNKIIWIKSAEKMTPAAESHLLKHLEEPQSYLLFILTTSYLNRIQATIRSRCRIWRMGFESGSNTNLDWKELERGEITPVKVKDLGFWVREQYAKTGDASWLPVWDNIWKVYDALEANGNAGLARDVLLGIIRTMR